MDTFAICGVAIVACMASILLSQYKPEYRIVLVAVSVVLIISAAFRYLIPLKDTIDALFENTGNSYSLLEVLYKCLAITYISGLTSDICTDAGERTLAANIELAGKIAVVYSALPLITETVKIVESLTTL